MDTSSSELPLLPDNDSPIAQEDCEDEEAPNIFMVQSTSSIDRLEENEIVPNPLYFHQINEKTTQVKLKLKCFTCTKLSSSFFCYSCIRNGEFTSSRCCQALKERFAEKKLRLFKLEEEKLSYCCRIESLLQTYTQIDDLNSKISAHKYNVEVLQKNLSEKRAELDNLKIRLNEISAQKQLSLKQPSKEKIEFTNKYIRQWKEKIQLKKTKCSSIESNIREETMELIQQLKQCIFPIEPYMPDEFDLNREAREEMVPLLAYDSASSGSGYETTTQNKYTVVEPWISVNTDYSSYNEWVNMHKESIVSATSLELGQRNPAFRTSAALAYITQMMNVLGCILDIQFPKRLSFNEFYTKSGVNGNDVFLTEKEFSYKIAKLNANIIYLCISQNIDPNLIHIRQALRNLLTLISSPYSDLGRRGNISIDPDFLICLEANLSLDLALFEEPTLIIEEDPNDMIIDLDWESIPHFPYTDPMYHDEQQSVTTNFMSSAASSIWRTVTGQK